MQAPRVTQIQVRVDCKGCVKKIKKALNGIHGRYIIYTRFPWHMKHLHHQFIWSSPFVGIYDLRVDLNRQKLTIVGWADPEQVVKAIKKTKKNATICSSIELTPPSKPTEPKPKGNAPAPNAAQKSPQSPPPQASHPSELPPQAPPPQASHLLELPPWQPPPEATPTSSVHSPAQNNTNRQWQSNTRTEELEQVHVTNHHLSNYANRFSSGHNHAEHWRRYDNGPVLLQEPSPSMYVTHSYNTHMPPSYVTECEYVRSPSMHTHYNCIEHYSGDYQNGHVNIASMFSDDNPNACCIV